MKIAEDYLYGHGKYALQLKEFFNFMKWEMGAFIVTSVQENDLKNDDRIVSVNNVEMEESDGIVVALSKKNVLEVKPYLEFAFNDKQLLFPYWE